MEFRNPDDITTGTTTAAAATTTLTFNQIRTSAFSKPTLSPSSSLILSPRSNFLSSSSTRNNNNNNNGNCFELPHHTSSSPPPPPPPPPPPVAPVLASTSPVKYRECLRNHAASIGGHVVDGCGEFMPSETDAMKCAACGCHRSFHRKDDYHRLSNGGLRRRGRSSGHVPLLLPPPLAPNPHLGSSATESSSEELNAPAQTHSAAVQHPKKRFRTKFTAEQKEKMLAFSERVGWRIQRQDEAIVEQFCAEAGVKRQVLKVWMHNNKNTTTVRKQIQQPQEQQQQQQQ